MKITAVVVNLRSNESTVYFEHVGRQRYFAFISEPVESLGASIVATPSDFNELGRGYYEYGVVPELVGHVIRAAQSLGTRSLHVNIYDRYCLVSLDNDDVASVSQWRFAYPSAIDPRRWSSHEIRARPAASIASSSPRPGPTV